jgi:hypothetical protein
MTSDQMSKLVERFFLEANELQWKKNRDYHPDGIAFLEILRTAAETGISVEQDLWAKIRKQYIALRGYLIDGLVESEPARSRMMDIAVYMGMVAFWDEHKKTIVDDAYAFVAENVKCSSPDGPCQRLWTQVPVCDECKFLFWLFDRAT